MKGRYRVTWSWAIILLTFAISIDIAQAILEWLTAGVSDLVDDFVIDPLILVLLWIIFRFFLKINFTRTRAFVFFALGLLEFVPVVKEFPLWTADVAAVMIMATLEDRITVLKKLDNTGLASKNPAKLKEMLNEKDIRTLKGASNVIMKGVKSASTIAPKGMVRNKMNSIINSYDSARQAKIEAQRSRKSNQPSNVIDATNAFQQNNTNDEERMAA